MSSTVKKKEKTQKVLNVFVWAWAEWLRKESVRLLESLNEAMSYCHMFTSVSENLMQGNNQPNRLAIVQPFTIPQLQIIASLDCFLGKK